MARVTVEDCIDKVPNRFELVLLAAHRARTISAGSPVTVDPDNDKNPVIALREIAEETINPGDLEEEFVQSMQRYVEVDEPEPEAVPVIAARPTVASSPVLGQDDQSKDNVIDRVSEEDMLRGMKSLAPADMNARSRDRS